MRCTTILASFAALASTALAADKCNAQNIVNACVAGYQERIERCRDNANDWVCLCDVYSDVLTCYNNCPNSNEKPPVQNQVTQFCEAAKPLRAAASASNASVASVMKTATTATPTSTAAAASATGSGSSTATGAAASVSAPAFATGAASSLTTPAGAAVVALFAAAGLF